jgi:iron complex transport system substrate-binding protein
MGQELQIMNNVLGRPFGRSRNARRTSAGLLITVLAVNLFALSTAVAAQKAGSICTKAGAQGINGSTKLVCSQSNGKLVWVAKSVTPAVTAPPISASIADPAPTKNSLGCVASSAGDLFPQKAVITDAKGLKISYQKTYKVVEIPKPWNGAKSGFTYVLVQCGTSAPDLTGPLTGATVIEVPIKTAAIMSTVIAPNFDVLGQADKVISVDDPSFYSTPSIVKRIANKQIKGTGGGARANVELLVSLKPSVVVTYGSGAASFDGIEKLLDAKLPALVEAGYMEETPLGRAEWVKLVGALTNTEGLAETEFARWKSSYVALVAKTTQVKNKPVVISGSMFKGTWYMPGGKSFAAQYIADAGGSYPWADDKSVGSLTLNFETVFEKGYDATTWINAGYLWNTRRDVIAEDARYARMLPFKNQRMWGNDKRVNATGGSDYFETAVVRPDLVLADLISVLHPQLLPNHTTIWYRQIKD